MSDSESSRTGVPARDVLALFNKANLGSVRYRTFAAQKGAEPEEAPHSSALVAEAAPATLPAPANHPRHALNAVFAGNARLRIEAFRPRSGAGSGAAVAFASCAGGAGKTTLCASVARILSARFSNVLVADRCLDGLIPYFFGLERQSAGGLQTVYPNARRPGYQMTLVAAPCEAQAHSATQPWLEQLQAEASLTLLDWPTFHGQSATLGLERAQVLVPLVPDVQSLASLARVEELCGASEAAPSGRSLFVLNRFDETRPLHREIRTHLEKLLEGRLATVAVRESEYFAEALSLGVTVVDHVPQAAVVKEIEQLVAWLEKQLASAAETLAAKVEIA